MAKPRLLLRSKTDLDLRVYAQSIIKGMRESPYFTAQQGAVEAAAVVVDEFATALTMQAVAETALRTATQRKKAGRKEAEAQLTMLAGLVAAVS